MGYFLNRHILQDATSGGQSSCGFAFGGIATTFPQCLNLADSLNADYTVFYNFTPSKADKLIGRLDVALDGPTKGNQYIAFGIPVTPGTMIGGSAIVIKSNSSAESGELQNRSSSIKPHHYPFPCLILQWFCREANNA